MLYVRNSLLEIHNTHAQIKESEESHSKIYIF